MSFNFRMFCTSIIVVIVIIAAKERIDIVAIDSTSINNILYSKGIWEVSVGLLSAPVTLLIRVADIKNGRVARFLRTLFAFASAEFTRVWLVRRVR